MSLTGDLEDLSVVDVLQFVHLGGRSGTLVLERPGERGEVTFHRGRIVAARAPGSRRLGDLLIADGTVAPALVARAAATQRAEATRRGLGQILVEQGALAATQLHAAVVRQIEAAIYQLVTWRRGRFVFELDDLRVPDEIAVDLGELLLEVDLNTQMVLLEAMRLFDERNARGTPPPPPRELEASVGRIEAVADAEPVRHRIHVVTNEAALIPRLAAVLPRPDHEVVRVPLRDAGSPPPGEPAPAVLIDLRGPRFTVDAIAQVRRMRPRALTVAITDDALVAAAYDAGALTVVSADPAVIASSLRSLWRVRHDLCGDGAVDAAVQAGFAKLRAVFTELRTGVMSATVSLTLMNAISDAVDRAVMFVVRRHELRTLGAFGQGVDGRSLAEATRGLSIPMADAGLLASALREGRARTAAFDDHVPAALAALLGAPRTGQVAVFPVSGAEREIAVVYADNGTSPRAIEQIEVLELAAAHVGISFENELLRRRTPRVAQR